MQNTKSSSNSTTLEITEHFNEVQLLIHNINPNLMAIDAGRGFGKSTGLAAPRMVHCAKMMPRMAGTFLAPSYRKFMDHMWPGIKKGFEKMKMVEGRDFVFLKRPPAHWDRPYMAPGSFDHFISFRNGSGYHIISFDHGQTSNALDTDCNITDEAKMINGEQAQEEVYNTMRGNRDHFGHLAEHYSKWIMSDKYIRAGTKHERWYADYKNQMDTNLIVDIVCTLGAIHDSQNPLLKAKLSESLAKLQKRAVFYCGASTIDNIHAVGLEYIEGIAKTNTAYGILTSIFNMDIKKQDGNLFYPLFNEVQHTYNASHNNRIDEIILLGGHDSYLSMRSCELDSDLIKDEPLKLLIDMGGNFNWGIVMQKKGANLIRGLKDFVVQKPRKLLDLADDVMGYYRTHHKKVFELYWPKDGERENYITYEADIQILIKHIERNGWVVRDMMPDHHKFIPHGTKYSFGEKVFDSTSQRDERFPLVTFNASNCFDTICSLSGAKLLPGEVNRRKDKRGEKKNETDLEVQRKQTHLSDAFDWLLIDYLPELLNDKPTYTTPMVG